MRKILISLAAAIVVAISGVTITFAQDDGPPNFVPVEMQVCNYRDGKDSGDFDKAMGEMTDWMAANDSAPYAGWKIDKWITGGTQDFDFLFLNAWPNGSTMGQDITHYVATANDAIEAFDDAAECPATLLFASLMVKAPPESDGQTDDFVLTFSDCNVADGRKTGDAIDAIREYAAYRDANGSPGGTYVWFPVLGGGDEDFDFKLLNSYENVAGYGDFYQWNIENASYLKRNELMRGLVDCDVSRAYIGDTIINTMQSN